MIKIATLVGLCIGDALGNAFEMKPANDPKLLAWSGNFIEGGTFWWGQPGQYTDDGKMAICLSSSLIEHQKFDPEQVTQRYLDWYNSGDTRGIGTTTAIALHRVKSGAAWSESGLTHNPDGTPTGGNGTAMRASPIGLYYRNDLDKLLEVAMTDASITHNSLEPKMGSVAVALATSFLANGTHSQYGVLEEVRDILAYSVVKDKITLAIDLLEQQATHSEALALIGVSGYVPETVGAAFYCFAATDNFRDAVIMAVKAGGDTDTTAAVVGSLAGTYYGLEGIPEEYKSQVENFDLLQALTDELLSLTESQ